MAMTFRSERVTLAQLRKLAREALGEDATVNVFYYDGNHAVAKSRLADVGTYGTDREARRQLRDLLQLIVMGRAAAKAPAPRRRATNGAGHRRKT